MESNSQVMEAVATDSMMMIIC